jgi:hypothetical protein
MIRSLRMMTSIEHTLVLLVSIVADNIDSLRTLNLLIRTSKSLRIAASDVRLITAVTLNMSSKTKSVLRKLFVLPEKVSLPLTMMPCPYKVFRLTPQCAVIEAFRVAMVIHEGVVGMANAFRRRQCRSATMRLVWKNKREDTHRQWQARRRNIEQINIDLQMIPSSGHVKTAAELEYMSFGTVGKLSGAYRDKRTHPTTTQLN